MNSHQNPIIQEGKAKFKVGKAFYRPQTQVVRDLGVLAASIYKADRGLLRVLDAMSGCGVRSLRYWLESQADFVWANEGNPELDDLLQENLQEAIAANQCQITHKNAHQIFFECHNQQNYYDLVDIDCFGSAAPYLHTSLWATKIGGLIYLTSTDGRTATGHLPENSLKVYGAYARCHPAAHEQGLRLLLGSIQQQAATKGLGIKPIFSLFSGQTYRLMLCLIPNQCLNSENYGFLGYCHHCGDYQTISWHRLGKVICPYDNLPLTFTGPMWLGELHDQLQLNRFYDLAKAWGWSKRLKLLEIMVAETDLPPYFYTLGEIGQRGKMNLPKRSQLIQSLQTQGYRATPTHINPEAIKTDADLLTCIHLAKNL